MVVLAVLACLHETCPGLAHEAKGQPDFPRSVNGVNRDGEDVLRFR
jgi:hypothetical protein